MRARRCDGNGAGAPVTRAALRVIQGGGVPATVSGLLDIAHELARAATLASEAEDCDADLRAEYLDEATGRTRAALALLEALHG